MTKRHTPPPHLPHSRTELARRYGVLLFMTIVTTMLTAISLLLILGYQIDPAEQTLTQGGLVKYDSFPTGATITQNNNILSSKTPHQQTQAAKSYQVNYSLKGYRPWNSRFTVEPGKLAWANYARLVPNTITITDLRTFPTLAQNLMSPNHHYMAALISSDQPLVTLIDLSDPKDLAITDIPIPPDVMAAADNKPQTFTLHEWSRDSAYFTLKHTYGDNQVEFLRFQRSAGNKIVNITKLLGSPFTEVRFYNTSHDEFYALSEGNLRRITVTGEGTLSAPIAERVSEFSLYKDSAVIYVIDRAEGKLVEANVRGTKINIASAPKTAAVHVSIGNYYDNFYAAMAIDNLLYIYKLNTGTKKAAFYATITLAAPASWIDMATTSRHVEAGHDTGYFIYDIDTRHAYGIVAKGTRGEFGNQPLRWLDESYVIFNADNTLTIRDYTGFNSEKIADAPTGYDSTLSRDEKSIFYIAAGEGTARILRQAHMVVK